MAKLENEIRRYYGAQSLPAERAEAIACSGRRPAAAWWRWGWVAVLVLLAGGGWLGFGGGGADAVLAEIAYNHQKTVVLDVASPSYDVVQAGLPRLDFSVLSSKAAFLRNYALVGGRYCSLQGELAAQLRMTDRVNGDTLTVYVCKLAPALSGLAPLEQAHGGVEIRLWEDGGRIFALARGQD